MIGGGTGGRMGLGPPLLFLFQIFFNFEFCLNIVNSSSTISIGSSVKANRLMKKMLQNFGSFCQYYF